MGEQYPLLLAGCGVTFWRLLIHLACVGHMIRLVPGRFAYTVGRLVPDGANLVGGKPINILAAF